MNASANARPIDNATLVRCVPSVAAVTPYHGMSERYRFIPTIQVVDHLRTMGFLPVRAEQSRSRVPGKQDFTRHMIRFRHSEYFPEPGRAWKVGDEIPELVLVNSHDGTTGYQLAAGILRLVCSNGMVVQSATLGSISVRHTGGRDFYDRISDATQDIAGRTPEVMGQIETWKRLALPAPAQTALAEAVLQVRDSSPDAPMIRPAELLRPRRWQDSPRDESDGTRDLWTTVNVIQENVIRGGVRGRSQTGRRYTSRPVKSVSEDLRLNRSLWTIAETVADRIAAVMA